MKVSKYTKEECNTESTEEAQSYTEGDPEYELGFPVSDRPTTRVCLQKCVSTSERQEDEKETLFVAPPRINGP